MDDFAERLRPRLIKTDDAAALDVHGRIDAAVLVPLYLGEGGDLHAVSTKRPDDMRKHPGQISFPGGRQDDGEDLPATALREACEEIGLDPGGVEVIGALAPTPTIVTNYAIYPFVGVIDAGRRWTLSPDEVSEVLELKIADVRDGYARRRLGRRGLPIRTATHQAGG